MLTNVVSFVNLKFNDAKYIIDNLQEMRIMESRKCCVVSWGSNKNDVKIFHPSVKHHPIK